MAQLTINLTAPYIIKQHAVISGSVVNILRITDDYRLKRVTAFCEPPFPIVLLWEGTAYDAIGQWTDADVIARIQEIYTIT